MTNQRSSWCSGYRASRTLICAFLSQSVAAKTAEIKEFLNTVTHDILISPISVNMSRN